MPYLIGGVTADHNDLIARTPAEFRSLNNIDVRTRHRVTAIEPEKKRVRVADLAGGEDSLVEYTGLLVATGAVAFVPPVEGRDLDGVFPLRVLADALGIMDYISRETPARAVIVGAGPIGLEMCEALRRLGIQVTLVEMAGHVMPLIDPELASDVQVVLEREGVTCLLGERLEGLEGAGRIRRVITGSGAVEADLVILGIGIRPDVGLASEAGVELGARGAIRVDRNLSTNLPGVFAAGDCATTTNTVTGAEAWIPLGSTARKQGRAAGECLSGADTEFPGVQGTSVVKCFDLTVGRTGLTPSEAEAAGFEPLDMVMKAPSLHEYYPDGGNMHLKLTAEKETGRLLGAQVVGELESGADRRLDVFAMAVKASLSADDLQYLDLAYAPPYSTAVDAAIIAGNLLSGAVYGKTCGCTPEGLD
ncbi:MAG: FAD-dependent oxidoreductase [Actinomycetota bacterium]